MTNRTQLGALFCSVAAIIGIVMSQYSQQIRTTEKGLAIIGNAEGCRRDPYRCPANVLTVGIGSTETSGQKIDIFRKYSNSEIAEHWVKDITVAEQCVNRYGNGARMPQGAFEAMVSLTFNVGCGAMKKSALFKMANEGYRPAMCEQFNRWIYAGGKPLNGLIQRRAQERALCLS